MNKKKLANLILVQMEAIKASTSDNTSDLLALINEVLRDAKQLAELEATDSEAA